MPLGAGLADEGLYSMHAERLRFRPGSLCGSGGRPGALSEHGGCAGHNGGLYVGLFGVADQ